MRTNLRLTLIALSVSLALAACGGGGGGSPVNTSPDTDTQTGGQNNGNNNPPGGNTNTGGGTTDQQPGDQTVPLPAAVDASASMTMSCVDAPAAPLAAQCSGSEIIRTDNGVALTSSGVQVYGKSTSDLKPTIANPEVATGFMVAPAANETRGTAEVRLVKAANGAVTNPQLLLSNFGIKWDGVHESPKIAETFLTTQGRVELSKDAQGRDVLAFVTLPPSSNTSFYDFASQGPNATQSHYANNRYFPRDNNPARCPTSGCPAIDVSGVQPTSAGNWSTTTGGTDPDITSAGRLHEDGDVHAGDGVSGGTGPGVPFPGSKGYRSFFNMGYHYANVAKWVSQDAVEIAEWTNKSNEHNLNRRGIVAFGDVTVPSAVPTTGSTTYRGWIRGWYADKQDIAGDPVSFRAEARVTVNFATRQVTLEVLKDTAFSDEAPSAKLPSLEFTATVGMGAAGSNVANYLNGTLTSGNLKGGIGGRFFGPVVTTGSSGSGPAEIGGSFSMTDASTGASVIGGLIAIKR